MGRMEKYEESNDNVYSRTRKNEDLYKDVYLNNTWVDFNKIMDDETLDLEEERREVIEFKTTEYQEKDYDINKYLQEKRLLRIKDNLPRSLDENIKMSDNEIDELVSKIEQREKEEDLFNDLLPDDEDTTIIEGNNELKDFVSDTVIENYVMNKDMDETNSFMDLDETRILEEKNSKKKKKKEFNKVESKKNKNNEVPIIIFCSIALVLIGVIIYIVVKVF